MPIEEPIRDEWRAPITKFLQTSLRAANPEALLAKTFGGAIGGIRHNYILLRIEDPSLCSADLCLTVVGRIAEGIFVADAMFTAGKKWTWRDVFQPIFGFQSMPLYFVSDRHCVTLFEAPTGWIIASAPCAGQ